MPIIRQQEAWHNGHLLTSLLPPSPHPLPRCLPAPSPIRAQLIYLTEVYLYARLLEVWLIQNNVNHAQLQVFEYVWQVGSQGGCSGLK